MKKNKLSYLRSLVFKDLLLAILAVAVVQFNMNLSSGLHVASLYAQDFEDDDFSEEEFSEDDFSDDDFGDDADFSDFDDEGDNDDSESNEKVAEEESNFDELDDDFEESEELLEQNEEDNLVNVEKPAPIKPAPQQEPEFPVEPVIVSQPSEPIVYFDEPDLNYEQRLHSIYQDYHNSVTPFEQWEAMVGVRKKETYEIQNKDTLWDISRTFFGDGEYWPKIWSVNGKITNPHLISKGNTIVFLMGNEAEAPAFTVADSASLTDDKDEVRNQIAESDISQGARDVIPPVQTSSPAVAQVPPSLPAWSLLPPEREERGSITVAKIDTKIGEQRHLVTSFISDKKVEGIGTIAEIEAGVEIATQGQYVYVKSEDPLPVGTGEKILVLKNQGTVQEVKLDKYQSENSHGYRQQVEGRIEIVEKVKSKDEDENYYKAIVLDSFNPIEVGGKLIRKKLKRVAVDLNGSRSNVRAKIIGGGLDNRRKLYSSRSITFLDKGKAAGISEGDILPIYENRRSRAYNDVQVRSSSEPTGWLKIVEADEEYSTALIVKAWKEIANGDQTGGEF